MTPPGKRCPRCRRRKPLAAFHRDASKRDGRTSWCGSCRNAARRLLWGPGPWRRLPDDGPRRCRGPCGRALPAAAFALLASGRRRGRCRACRAAQLAAAAARRRAAQLAAAGVAA